MIAKNAPASEKPALLIVDMQNAYCDPGGVFGSLGFDVARCASIVPHCQQLLEAAHEYDVPVIFTTKVKFASRDIGLSKPGIREEVGVPNGLLKGSWGSEIVAALTTCEQDLLVEKLGYSAFHSTTLDHILGSLGVSTIAIAGVTSSVCVASTVRSAVDRGYRVSVAKEAVADFDIEWEHNALTELARVFADVVRVDEVLHAWEGRGIGS